jgi:predicted DNA-binding transcriptional regulator AlpA
MESQRWFELKEVCAVLNISVRVFKHRVARGLLPRGVKRGRKLGWSKEDLDAMHWLEMHRRRLGIIKPRIPKITPPPNQKPPP